MEALEETWIYPFFSLTLKQKSQSRCFSLHPNFIFVSKFFVEQSLRVRLGVRVWIEKERKEESQFSFVC